MERFGARVYAPRPDTADDLMRKFGISRERAGDGNPDITWLREAGAGVAHSYAAGDRLPFGVEAFEGREENDLVLWVERVRALIPGDTLVDFGRGFELNRWLRGGVTREEVVARLRPLLDLPAELVLPTHGEPAGRDALERALA